jgi:hypothetical protein
MDISANDTFPKIAIGAYTYFIKDARRSDCGVWANGAVGPEGGLADERMGVECRAGTNEDWAFKCCRPVSSAVSKRSFKEHT